MSLASFSPDPDAHRGFKFFKSLRFLIESFDSDLMQSANSRVGLGLEVCKGTAIWFSARLDGALLLYIYIIFLVFELHVSSRVWPKLPLPQKIVDRDTFLYIAQRFQKCV